MRVLAIALGGCLRSEPVQYGITEDTGGHIAYILGAMRAIAADPRVAEVEIVTRLFEEDWLDPIHAQPVEPLAHKFVIRRIDSGNRAYLAKDALAHDRAAFTAALIADLRSRKHLPDIIHAHFADAADVAAKVRDALGIPFIYTAHSLGLDKLASLGAACAGLRARVAEENRAIGGADAIVGSSRDECERQLLAYPDADVARVHRIIPGVREGHADDADIDAARALVAPFLRDPDRPMILAIARPVHKKNLVGLVEAYAAHPDLRERTNLVILAGQRDGLDGREDEQRDVMLGLLAAIDRHDLYGHVAYPRKHARRQVDGLYALAASQRGVFVNPALIEPYGLTLIEAASYGLPVVATNRGGPVDIVGELEHGALVDPTDTKAIGDAIANLLSDRTTWDAASRRGRVGARAMTWESYAREFVTLAQTIGPGRSAEAPAYETARELIISDMDNTLTGCRDGADRFRRFCSRQRGMLFGIATGRSLSEARRIAHSWRLPTPSIWITSVGTEIYWQRTLGLQPDTAYAQRIAWHWDGAAVEEALRGINGLTPQADYEQRTFKRSYLASSTHVVQAVEERLRAAGLNCRVVFSHKELLDILPVRAGKAAAMRHVADCLGIPDEHVFAAGDSGNDTDMLRACHNAILVANHAPEIEQLRDCENVYVSSRNHAGGALEGVLAHRLRRRAAKGERFVH